MLFTADNVLDIKVSAKINGIQMISHFATAIAAVISIALTELSILIFAPALDRVVIIEST